LWLASANVAGVEWNIERGLQFEMIRLAFSNSKAFLEGAERESGEIEGERRHTIEAQLERLQQSDVIILNEVDLGMRRTEYRDVARDLARSLDMNYAYGVEFVEVDPLTLGIERFNSRMRRRRLNFSPGSRWTASVTAVCTAMRS